MTFWIFEISQSQMLSPLHKCNEDLVALTKTSQWFLSIRGRGNRTETRCLIRNRWGLVPAVGLVRV